MLACAQLHLINLKTGKVLGAKEDRAAWLRLAGLALSYGPITQLVSVHG